MPQLNRSRVSTLTLVSAALGGALVLVVFLAPAGARAEAADLIYDDGRPAGMLRGLTAGDIEVVRMTPEHPARLVSVRLYFAGSAPCTAHVVVWPDNGGNAPDDDHPLWESDIEVPGRGWSDVTPPADTLVFDPPHHFYAGHVVGESGCQLAWDNSGATEPRSLARIGGNWYQIVNDSSQPIDALVRATVDYFNVREVRDFEDVTASIGLEPMYRVAWGDYDGDGDDDLLSGGNRLFRNDGGMFTDVSAEAGLADAAGGVAVWADYDNDGRLDFYSAGGGYYKECGDDADCVRCTVVWAPDGSGSCGEEHHDHTCVDDFCMPPSSVRTHDLLWHNEGGGVFREVSAEAGVYDFAPSEAAAWGDYDNDGFVDLYVANYETSVEWTRGAFAVGNPDRLWRNNGDGTFSDVSETAGVAVATPRCGRTVAWADYDLDGDLDLFVGNYRLGPDFFFQNQGDGTFVEIARENGTIGNRVGGAYGHALGAVWGDYDNDGDWDLFVANLAHPRFLAFSDKSMLYRGSGAPDFMFVDAREAAGIAYSETHTGPAWGDYDNDGNIDLFITQVYAGYRAFMYRSDGDGTFTDATYPAGIVVDNGFGASWGDYDQDGKLDLAAQNLWHNRTADVGHWLEVRLAGAAGRAGTTPASNTAAIGAVVTVTAGGRTLMRQVEGGGGAGVQNSMTLHFGLGAAARAERVVVAWPSGLVHTYENVPADQIVDWHEWETPGGEDAGDGGEADGGDGDAGDADAAGTGGSSGGGCACRAVPASGEGPAAAMVLVLVLAGLLRWRVRSRWQASSRQTAGIRSVARSWNDLELARSAVMLFPAAVLIGVLAGSDAQAYTWSSLPVPWYLQQDGCDDVGSDATEAAVRAAFDAWERVDCCAVAFDYRGRTALTAGASPGANVVSWSDTWSADPMAMCITHLEYDGGAIVEADIACNGAFIGGWGTGLAARVDIQSVLTHEVGHLFGLDHVSDPTATMYHAYTLGTIDIRSLGEEDLAGCRALYPASCAGCTGDSDCSYGYLCRDGSCVFVCRVNAECAAGYVCEGGSCVFVAPPECIVDSDCPAGMHSGGTMVCLDGACVEPPPDLRRFGEPCTADAECTTRLCFDGRCTQACSPFRPREGCPAGYYCDEIACGQGRCRSGGPGAGESGSPCVSDGECASAYCSAAWGGVCLDPCNPGAEPDGCAAPETCQPVPSPSCGVCLCG
ncbi:MAG: FG-GAP-like repeat-containing protein, partial [Myxococcota bacterium]|nr:FG-GAP-like repeat-containing protein [Myxococcota bacterium]